MVRPGLTKYRMHPAVLNRLDKSLNIAKSLLTATVSNQQSCSLVGNSQLLKQFTSDLPEAYDLRQHLIHFKYSRDLLVRIQVETRTNPPDHGFFCARYLIRQRISDGAQPIDINRYTIAFQIAQGFDQRQCLVPVLLFNSSTRELLLQNTS